MTEARADLDLRLLGPVRVWRDGVEVVAGADRRAAVLCVLALKANQTVSREELVAALWGDEPPASALGNVYTHVSMLRRVLEPQRGRWSAGQVLSSVGGSYRLEIPDDAVDVHRFERARKHSRYRRANNEKMAELRALEDALGIWHGDALAGVPGPYAATQRARLAELRLASVERHAALLLDLGRNDEAVAVLRELVDGYPLQEKFHGLLMTALQASGRGAEALNTYRHARKLLARLVGAQPGPLLEEAYRRLTGETAAESRPLSREPVLVGREAEVRLLRQAVAQVAAGTGGHIRLEGAPGIGKSAVLAAGLRSPRPAAHRIGWSRCENTGPRLALGTLTDCLESAYAGEKPSWASRLRAAAGAFSAADSVDLVGQVVTTVRDACAESPLILAIDDLQWADPVTLQVWPVLQRLTARLPLLLASAARPDRQTLQGLGWDGAMPLGPLAPAEATSLVESVARRPLSTDLTRRIVTDAGGNPCYLLAGVEAAVREYGPPSAGVPEELVVAVTRHLAVLDEPTRHILRAVAFLGDDCDLARLATATAKPMEALRGAVQSARAAGFLPEFSETMTFRHRIVARILDEGTPSTLRIMLHRSFAEQFAASGMAPKRVIAQLLAGPVPLNATMSAWLVRNIETAAEQSPRNAVQILRQARSQSNLGAETLLTLTAWLARLLLRLERNAATEAGWVAARTPDTELEAEMRWIVALSHERQGDIEEAAEVARWVLSARRAPDAWLGRFRELVDRIRPQMSGFPTGPHEQTVTNPGHSLRLKTS